jgi:hypothetical protein
MMFQRAAGQYAASDGTAYQWAWSPKSATEAWSDNNHLPPGTRVVETFRRTSTIAKGVGMSFVNDTQVPATWHVEATQYWNR